MRLPLLKDTAIEGKRVFLRADLDVPLSQQTTSNPFDELRAGKQRTTIEDDTRIRAAIPTIKHLLKHNAKVIIAGHLDRPKGFDKSLSLEPIAQWLFKEFKIRNLKFEFKLKIKNLKFTKLGDFDGWEIGQNIFLLENLRFYEGEEQNDEAFAKKLASLAEIYVNDDFSVCHRNHASIAGVPKYLPHFAGLQLQKEIEVLGSVVKNPKRPLVVIVGGAKVETKLPLVERMHRFANYVLVGGKIAKEERVLLKVAHEKIQGQRSVLLVADLNKDKTDITEKSVENFLQIVSLAKTVVWNGPVGKVPEGPVRSFPPASARSSLSSSNELRAVGSPSTSATLGSAQGTTELAKGIIKSGVYTVVGGGDTVGFLKKIGLLPKFSFVSTGGGAMLAFLSGEKLPGLEALLLK